MKLHETLLAELMPKFFFSLKEILKFRLVSKAFKQSLDNLYLKYNPKKHDKDLLYTMSTFLPVAYCWNCNVSTTSKQRKDYIFRPDDFPKRSIIVCYHWKCRIKAIHTMLQLAESFDLYNLVQPLDDNLCLKIPRSDPNKNTEGNIQSNFSDVIYFKNNKVLIRLTWLEDSDKSINFYKDIPIEQLKSVNPTISLSNLRIVPFHSKDILS